MKTTFTIAATIDTFAESVFKTKLAALLAPAGSDFEGTVTPEQISLSVSGGSIQVEASVSVYSESVAADVISTVDGLTPAAASSSLGYTVTGVTKAEKITKAFSADDMEAESLAGGQEAGGVGGVGLPVIVGAAAGGGGLLLLVIFLVWRKRIRKGKAKAKAKTQANGKTDPASTTTTEVPMPIELPMAAAVPMAATVATTVPMASEKLKFCSNCGTKLKESESQKFCVQCGTKI